jgi:hypothetical protein
MKFLRFLSVTFFCIFSLNIFAEKKQNPLYPHGGSSETWVYDRDPTSNEIPSWGEFNPNNFWRNTATIPQRLFMCIDATPGAMKWVQIQTAVYP